MRLSPRLSMSIKTLLLNFGMGKATGVWLMLAYCYCLPLMVLGQESGNSVSTDKVIDTNSFVRKVQKIAAEEAGRSIEKYRLARIAHHQEVLLKEVMQTIHEARSTLKDGIDTNKLRGKILSASAVLTLARSGLYDSGIVFTSQRNLSVSTVILSKLLEKVSSTRDHVSAHLENLISYRTKIDSLYSDSTLYVFPSDSTAAMNILQRIAVAVKDIGPTDSLLDKTIIPLSRFRNELDMQVFAIAAAKDDLAISRGKLANRTLEREFAHPVDIGEGSRSITDIIRLSLAKERLALYLYVTQNGKRFVVFLTFLFLCRIFLNSLKRKVIDNASLDPHWKGQLVLRYPSLSAFVLVTSIFQFMFLEPPFIFNMCIWIMSAVALAIIFRGYVTGYWLRFWIIMITVFGLAGLLNFVLHPSPAERFSMYLLSTFGVIYGSAVLFGKNRIELREINIIYFIAFVVVAEAASIILNLAGRYNISKSLMITGFSGVIVAILFLWTVRFLNEGLKLTSEVYKHPDRNLFFINFNKVGDRVPGFFYVLLILGWVLLAGKNFYGVSALIDPITEFLSAPRVIGDYSFTINSLALFFSILICAFILSRFISFFASDSTDHTFNTTNKVTLGSWLLLIRILVVSSGIFLAFAATGLPLDKLTIILGALSVGIGLGLQGLVSNLVSGLIIAFEKPVNVGDMIEVDNKTGYMKLIGFRSSVVNMTDGSTVIIPNGDLLKDHLVNWTVGRKTKRLELEVDVAYGTDLQKTRQILFDILTSNKELLHSPGPAVFVKSLNANSITIQLFFWGGIYQDLGAIRGEIIVQIEQAFRSENIVIPVPPHPLHIITEAGQNDNMKLGKQTETGLR
jgi:potassium-dependent mechanosensitive channel